ANSVGLMKSLTASAATESRAMFEVNKIASLASATTSGIEAVQHSYKSGAAIGGPILGAAFAGIAVAATAANLKKIQGTSFGGGASVGAAGSSGGIPSQALSPAPTVSPTAATNTQAAAPVPIINNYFTGNVMDKQYITDTVMPHLQMSINSGDSILIAPDSAQALVLAQAV
ncbi:MAG: hypothetical protein Q9N02_11520, partial [Ghiorsea sp.]|nr:hypothetical protein [Ghiorsea sp.]